MCYLALIDCNNLCLGTHGFHFWRKVQDVVRREHSNSNQLCVLYNNMGLRAVSRLCPLWNTEEACQAKPRYSTYWRRGRPVGKLFQCLLQMSEMGYGLSRHTMMHLAYKIVNKAQRKHPFKDKKSRLCSAWWLLSTPSQTAWPFDLLSLCRTVTIELCRGKYEHKNDFFLKNLMLYYNMGD